MNMKKISGTMVAAAALAICGTAGAAQMSGSSEVQLEVVVQGSLDPVACTFAGNKMTNSIAIGSSMGLLTCTNPNSAGVKYGIIGGSGTTDTAGTVVLQGGAAKIYGTVNKSKGTQAPVYTFTTDSTELAGALTLDGGERSTLGLEASVESPNTPSGVYKGSVHIGTWAA